MESSDQGQLQSLLQDIIEEVHALEKTADDSFTSILDSCDKITHASGGNAAISEEITAIYESCASHDLTRQRLQKILRLTRRIMNPDLPADDVLLEGPQSGNSGLSQHAADQLMKGGD